MKQRMYHVVAINEKSGKKVVVTGYPMTHQECCILLSKLTPHPARRLQLEEV
jgi:hypothetical protein